MSDTDTLLLDLRPLDALTPDRPPLWGKMSPQHMVEHLETVMRVSNGELTVRVVTPEDRVPLVRRYLLADRPFGRNIKNPLLGDGLIPLRHADLEAAKARLREEVERFHSYFAEHPDATPHHPAGGPLNRMEWLIFHTKHMRHHFSQFGLLPEDEE